MTKNSNSSLGTMAPADPAQADVPCAEALVDMLTDDIGPAIAAMLATINAAEDAYTSTPAIRDGFDHGKAEDGWASIRHYLEHAAIEVRRIVRAKR